MLDAQSVHYVNMLVAAVLSTELKFLTPPPTTSVVPETVALTEGNEIAAGSEESQAVAPSTEDVEMDSASQTVGTLNCDNANSETINSSEAPLPSSEIYASEEQPTPEQDASGDVPMQEIQQQAVVEDSSAVSRENTPTEESNSGREGLH